LAVPFIQSGIKSLVLWEQAMAFERPSEQARTIGDWIVSQHGSGFVGRSAELSLFNRAARGELGPTVIYVHGPGGSGKTSLLQAMRSSARELGHTTYWLDSGTPMPNAVLSNRTGSEVQSRQAGRSVVFVDELDRVRSAKALRDGMLYAVPADVLVVLASRRPPDVGWRRSGWEHVISELRLARLSEHESMALLDQLGVPATAADEIQRWAGGSPLTLVLAAKASLIQHDVVREGDIAATVMAVVSDGELDPRFHDALHVCAIARTTTLDLLTGVLDMDPLAAFEWLAERSFIDRHGGVLILHEMVRAPMRTALAAVSTERDHELRRRICDHSYRRAAAGDRSAFADLAHLVSNPTVQWGYRLDTNVRYRATAVRDGDAAVLGARLRHRGYREWWGMSREYYRHSEANIVVARDNEGAPAGHAIGFVPTAAPRELLASDPIGAGCATYAGRIGAASTTLVWRDTVVLSDGRDGPADAGLCSLLNISLALRADAPGLRHALIPAFDQRPRVHEFCRAVGGRLVPDLRWTVDGRPIGCYHIDWGAGGLSTAQRNLVYRELQLLRPGQNPTAVDIRRALDAFTSDDVLSACPLANGSTVSDRAESVRTSLRSAAAAALAGSPHAVQLKTIVERRFFVSRDSHEAIARSLAVSRATYFRRLHEAVDGLTRHLLDQDT
jgi:hypothetical protein